MTGVSNGAPELSEKVPAFSVVPAPRQVALALRWRPDSGPAARPSPAVAAYVAARTDASAGLFECWPWTGDRDNRDGRGYGLVRIAGRPRQKAHRLAWSLANGPIPAGMLVCHHCDNPPCVNPGHLYVGTPSDNRRDMHARGRARGRQRGRPGEHPRLTHCRNGHEFTPENVIWQGRDRLCRACHNARRRAVARRASSVSISTSPVMAPATMAEPAGEDGRRLGTTSGRPTRPAGRARAARPATTQPRAYYPRGQVGSGRPCAVSRPLYVADGEPAASGAGDWASGPAPFHEGTP